MKLNTFICNFNTFNFLNFNSMIKKIQFILAVVFIISLTSCSGIKVLNSWTSPDATSLDGKKVLVIARTNKKEARIAFEDAITAKVRKAGLQASQCYKAFPDLDQNKKLSEKEVEEAKRMLEKEGYSVVIISLVKDKKLTVDRKKEGGYYAGAGAHDVAGSAYYPNYYSGFYGYYSNNNTYVTSGNYVPETMTVQESMSYVLETLVYDLNQPEDRQLIGEVTSSIEDPENAHQTAKTYADKVAAALKK